MNCPACKHEMTEVEVRGIKVDVCEGGCGGLWFDYREFSKFDEPFEEGGELLLECERDPGLVIDRTQRLRCPKCPDSVLMQHFHSVKREVEVDECPTCAGFWLDVGELARIRQLYPSDEARQQAAREYLNDVFGPRLEAHFQQMEEVTEKYRRIARAFRFLYPSYYIPGDQDWGAF